jgi:hypothetical protein
MMTAEKKDSGTFSRGDGFAGEAPLFQIWRRWGTTPRRLRGSNALRGFWNVFCMIAATGPCPKRVAPNVIANFIFDYA